jgi:phage shock protein PspC (stress-responsive transcriptional regulator)
MRRSFSDRVFGGVCGGLAASLHLSAWLVRVIWALLTIATLGAFAALYVLLWWIVPQESLVNKRRGIPTLFIILLIILTAAAWIGHQLGQLTTTTGVNLFWPGMLLILSVVFFLRQLRTS